MASSFSELDAARRQKLLDNLLTEYEEFKSRGLKLDMSRGNPCKEQLDLSLDLFKQNYTSDFFKISNGMDSRNYGVPTGISEMKEIFSEILEIPTKNIIVGGNSSLNLMYDFISRAYTEGVCEGTKPWKDAGKIKWLCPSPGYDRHFAVTERFGFELVEVPMTENGPDIDLIERLVAEDEAIKGMWCVPVYSNFTGAVVSDETVRRLANMKCKASDFTIMWDNAYAVHHLYDEKNKALNLFDECEKVGCPERAVTFTSTSKVTFAGAGVSCIAASDKIISAVEKDLKIKTIGYDKINQLMHAKFLKNLDGVNEQMKKHADIIRPKFEAVERVLGEQLDGLGIASYTKPRGGYFICLVVPDGTAKKIVAMCADAGVKLTPAGAGFPYGKDSRDNSIRIAPTYPSYDEIVLAAELIALCTKIASLEAMVK